MKKRVPILVCILAVVLAAILAFMASYAILTDQYKKKIAAYSQDPNNGPAGEIDPAYSASDKISLLATLMEYYSYYDIDEELLAKALAFGFAYNEDAYAYYYTKEELEQSTADSVGDTQGIGITVIEDKENACIKVVSVVKDSPAYKNGVQMSDRITRVSSGGVWYNVADLGYEPAVKCLQGKSGTYAVFEIARGEKLEETVSFQILREPYTSESVMYHISTETKNGKKIGVVKIINFDLTTPTQFKNAMDSLIADGCEYYIFDVRYNPGGDLASITAVLSTLLQANDTVIITKDKYENSSATYVKPVAYASGSIYAGCSVTAEDIGKYRDTVNGKCAVLVNGSTASAAELFTCSLKDYGIGKIVGTKTYGKGSMQSMIDLSDFGYEGAIKLTTRKYFPPISEGYDGIGIEPDVTVELADALQNRNIYDIADKEDNQFAAAVAAIQ